MSSVLKVVLGVIAGVVALVAVAIVALALFFDANDYRQPIIAKVEQATGRSFSMASIHLTVFPILGLKLDDAALGNAKGFGQQPFARVGEVDVGVRLLPLIFHRRLEIGSVYLSNLQLNLEKSADGHTNWQDLVGGGGATGSSRGQATGGGGRLGGLAIGGINVENADLRYQDAVAHRGYRLKDLNLTSGPITFGRPFGLRARFDLQSTTPAFDAQVTASGEVNLDPAQKRYQVQSLSIAVRASGKAVPGGQQDVKLTGDLDYEGASGQARLAGATLQVAGISLRVSLAVRGIGNSALEFSGPLIVEPFAPRQTLETLGVDYRPAAADALAKAGLSAQIHGGRDRAALTDLRLKLDQTTASGELGVSDFSHPRLRFAMKLDRLDADRYLPAEAREANKPSSPVASGGSDQPVPVRALDRYGVDGRLDIGKLRLHGMELSNVAFTVSGPPGAAKLARLDAGLYGGKLSSVTRISPGAVPGYREKLTLDTVNAGPLLQDLLGKDYVTGVANAAFDLSAAGDTVMSMRRSLGGTVAFKFADGAVKGFNLGEILRNSQALLNGQPPAVTGGTRQTDFSSLSLTGKIADGVLTSDDLNAASPLLRVTGAGRVNLVDLTVDYTLKPMLVNTATGQNGKTLQQLRGVVIPIHVTGPLAALRYQVDAREALKQQAEQHLRRQLDKSNLKQKLEDKLKSLFGHGGG